MKTINKLILKRVYNTPVIQNIAIDNEISLILTSIPQPVRQFEKESEENNFNDPYKIE